VGSHASLELLKKQCLRKYSSSCSEATYIQWSCISKKCPCPLCTRPASIRHKQLMNSLSFRAFVVLRTSKFVLHEGSAENFVVSTVLANFFIDSLAYTYFPTLTHHPSLLYFYLLSIPDTLIGKRLQLETGSSTKKTFNSIIFVPVPTVRRLTSLSD
jgi:hypothetical protein